MIWNNLNVHKSPRAAGAIAERKAWILFLPRNSPDNNPIEIAFSKLKALLRKMKARTYDDLWKAVGKSATYSHRKSAGTIFASWIIAH